MDRIPDVPRDGGAWRVHAWGPRPPGWVALHGFSGTGADLEPVAAALGGLAAPDLPGHGGTTGPDGTPLDRLAVELATLLGALSPRPPAVIGYSMGGRVALRLALDHPAALSSLVLVGATPGIATPRARASRRASDRALADSIERDGVDAFAEAWDRAPVLAGHARIDPRWLEPMRARRRAQRPRGLAESLRASGTGAMEPLWDRLGGLALPVLLVTGERDRKFGAIARRMASRLPAARHAIVPGAGHAVHLERPGEFAAIVRGWVRGG